MPQPNSEKPDIFIYKMTTDNGGAPCIKNGLISLCICKPNIRINPSADKGDWIIGMGGKSVKDLAGRLIYIMKVKECVKGSEYYKPNGKYWNRPDCIYELDGTNYKLRKGAEYHQDGTQLERDIGNPPKYDRAVCLVGDEFAYFGDGKKINPDITKIKDIYDALPRDYRKNHKNENYEILSEYINYIMGKYKYECIHPTHTDKTQKCNETEDEVLQNICG